MKRILHIVLGALLLALPSCEIPFPVKPSSGERFYAQCIADDSGVSVFVRTATPVNAPESAEKTPRISVEVNSEPLEVVDEDGHLRGYRPLKEGDRIHFHVEADGVSSADGSTVAPRRPVIKDCSWQRVQVDTIEATEVSLTLDRAPSEEDFFAIRIEQTTHVEGTNTYYTQYITPGYILSAAESGSFDLSDFIQLNFDDETLGCKVYRPITLLTQKQFDGTIYRFYINSFDSSILDGIRDNLPSGDTGVAGGGISSGGVGGPAPGGSVPGGSIPGGSIPGGGEIPDVKVEMTYTFTLFQLSPEFYYYARALFQSNFDFLSNMGLIPANFTWSNLEGGLGFVGALQSDSVGPFVLDGEN